MTKCRDIGKEPLYLPLGPQPFKYMLGMGPAVNILTLRLDPGRLRKFAQFNTFKSSLLDLSEIFKASNKGVIEGAYMG